MKKESKTNSSAKISKKILHSPTVIHDVEYCRMETEKENEGENVMRDVVRNEEMNIEEIVKERIKENGELFNQQELEIIDNNFNAVIKIYLLAILDTK